MEAIAPSQQKNESTDIIDILMEISYKNRLIIDKDAVEYIMLNESKKDKILSIISKYETTTITKQTIEEELEKIKKDIEAKIQILRASMYYESKNYDVKIERIWNLNTSYEAKTSVKNFINYFNDRFKKIKNLLLQRNGVKNVVSIENLKDNKTKNSEATIIVMVREKIIYNNGFMKFIVEDPTGVLEAIPNDEIKQEAEMIVNDDTLALRGKLNNKGKFVFEEIIYPDIPLPSEGINKLDVPLTAAFISDLHFGSKKFIKPVMERFFKWLKSGDDLASRLKFLFILGDNVDGIGIYPEQPKELEIANIYDQYKAFEDFLLKIPDHINVIVIPGNHDAVRLAEPQPEIPPRLMPHAHEMKNIYFETNPSLLKIEHETHLKVLLYHGYSFNAIIDSITEIRKVARDKPTYVMREILKRRHLAPIYGSTLIAPKHIDMHVIDIVPDIFASGDLHSHHVMNYKGTTLISASTWQDQTAFQDRVGHVANPGKLTIVDLQTREFFVKDLYKGEI